MEKSKQFQEILNLGKALVTLFSQEDRTDLTTSWMAHYLAEIMQEVREAKDLTKKRALQKECSAIILELWKKRNQFPGNVAPLSGIQHAVSVIGALEDEESDDPYYRRFRNFEDRSVWGTYIYTLRKAVEDSFKITLGAVVAKSVLDREKLWKEHKPFISEQEKVIIDFLDRELTKEDSPIKIVFVTGDEPIKNEVPPDKMTMVFRKLHELLNKQVEALDKLEKQVLKPKVKSNKSRKD